MKNQTIACDICGFTREAEAGAFGGVDTSGWLTVSGQGPIITGDLPHEHAAKQPDLCSWKCVSVYAAKVAETGGDSWHQREYLDAGTEYRRVAAVLVAARAEALEERPLSCAAVNSVIDRLADVYAEHDPGFDRDAFCVLANYRGESDGTTGTCLLP